MNKYLKYALWIMCIWVVLAAMVDGSKKHAAGKQQAVAPVEEPVNRCFERGYSIASAYVNNLQGATEAGVLASEMMARGCAEVSATETSTDCRGQCEAGFKHKAKTWLKQ
ncbi:hypothetical protein [Roseateles sp. PN1]|uniref:hypothetical protein n=1 Tax=Roseateles sp. PN1 TaxID=3137372 RepID=UPI0031386EED